MTQLVFFAVLIGAIFFIRALLLKRTAVKPATAMVFENPVNGYREECSSPGLWAFLFGGFYFASKGIWTHAIVGLLLAIPTLGLSWLIYAAKASTIVRNHYLRLGWREVAQLSPGLRKCPFCAEMIRADAKICRYCQREVAPV